VGTAFGTYGGYRGRLYRRVATRSLHVPMRDGLRLAADVLLPADAPPGATFPAIVMQTRYWRAADPRLPLPHLRAPKAYQRFFVAHGYALIHADVRGTGASFGTWPHPWGADELADGAALVAWIVAQPWSNGRVGALGTSYDGTTAELLAASGHPAVGAVIPCFNEFDVYTDLAFPGGIYHAWFVRTWERYNRRLDAGALPADAGLPARLLVRGPKPVDGDRGRRLLRAALREHAVNGDVEALARGLTYRDDADPATGWSLASSSVHTFRAALERSGVALFGWGSWLDAGTADAVLKRFLTLGNPQRAVIGPWNHGAARHASPYQPPDAPTDPRPLGRWLEYLRFFDHHLDGVDNGAGERTLTYYTLGEERWKTTATWPPAGAATERWYLAAGGRLATVAPDDDAGADRYAIDFAASTGATNRWHTQVAGGPVAYGDRAAADRRLLTYTSPPLDGELELTGHPVVTLYVTSTMPDGAFFVYLEDVDEAGRVVYATEGQLRALHRRLSDTPPPYASPVPYRTFARADALPLVPGEVAALTFGLLPLSLLVRRGHRLRVAIAGHDADTFARLPSAGRPVITVARNRLQASHIDLPVVRAR